MRLAQAVEWLTKAAHQGCIEAQHNLGLMYGRGQGVIRDEKEAFFWFLKAAEKGFVEAQYALGQMYLNSLGVGRNDIEALRWYIIAAKQGHLQAQAILEIFSRQGYFREQPLSDHALKIEKPEIKATQQVTEDQHQNESKTSSILYPQEGDAFISTAVQYAEEGYWAVAKHLGENSDKEYKRQAEDAELAEKLQREEMERASYNEDFAMPLDDTPILDSGAWKGEPSMGNQEKPEIIINKQQEDASSESCQNNTSFITINSRPSPHSQSTASESISLTLEKQKLEKEDEETLAKTGVKIIRGEDGKIKDRIVKNPMNLIQIMDSSSREVYEDKGEEGDKASSSTTTTSIKTLTPYPDTETFQPPVPFSIEEEQAWRKTEKAISLYNLQGEKYLTAAIQNAEEGNPELAKHCEEEAERVFQLAADSQLALELQQQEDGKNLDF